MMRGSGLSWKKRIDRLERERDNLRAQFQLCGPSPSQRARLARLFRHVVETLRLCREQYRLAQEKHRRGEPMSSRVPLAARAVLVNELRAEAQPAMAPAVSFGLPVAESMKRRWQDPEYEVVWPRPERIS